MRKRKLTIATVMGVVAAMVLTAAASAAWKQHGVELQEGVQFGLTTHHHQTPNGQVDSGDLMFSSTGLGSLQCQVTSRVKLSPGQTGSIETLVPHPLDSTTNCKGGGGLALCQVHGVTVTGLPWTFHTTGLPGSPDIQITNGEIHSQTTGAFCPVNQVTITPGTLTAVPVKTTLYHEQTSGNTVQYLAVQGTASIHTTAGSDAAAAVKGTFEVEPPTYDI